ncbi:amidohydrolase family protein [Micromonospora sp. NPDC005215]|uniref:amidohydrolase family protein n=1 Tax=Micromonospora sp. NPDC005215 TaxID=3157024 RepID=UPI00339E3488
MRILDGHCHVASTHFIPLTFLADVAAGMHRRLASRTTPPPLDELVASYVDQHQDHQADELVSEMDAAGVDRAVLLIPDFGLVMPEQPSMMDMARRHHAIRLRHPGRFWVYLGADPRRGEAGVRDVETAVERYGFDGVKLYPPCGYSPSDQALYPLYEVCRQRRLPVFVHIGPTAQRLAFTPAHPLLVDQAARDFPDVQFVLGHGGVTHLDVTSYLAAHRPNVYLDTGGFAGARAPEGWPTQLNRLFRMGLNHKIIFGTDWPLNRMSGGLRRLVTELVDGEHAFDSVPRGDRELILGGNLLRVLPPHAHDVGVRTVAEVTRS